MLPAVLLFTLLVPLSLSEGQEDLRDPVDRTCDIIKNYHCEFFHDDLQCGTDHTTYKNMCEFSKAHCAVRTLHVAHAGACDTSGVASTQTPGGDAVFRFFCQNLSHQQCGDDQQTVCGSDGHTYSNLCLYEKARCQDHSLSVASYIACTTTSSP